MSKNKELHPVVENLVKILNTKEDGKKNICELEGFSESKLSKILNGSQKLRVSELSKIASAINMREIDIYTYPKVFREFENFNSDIKAQLTVELNDNLKDDVLKMIFGNSNLKLINK